MSIERVTKAIQEIRAGRMVILVDDEDRENEGDLCMAAQFVTPEAINFMATYGRGLICLPMAREMIERLQIPMMVQRNTSPFGTAFTESIEASRGVSTGISAADRAHTVLTAVADDARPEDLVRPGHVFPLRAAAGGVLVRLGQTEGSVDLARLAGLKPAGVICEIMKSDGTMARLADLEEFSKRHGLMILTIQDLIAYRLRRESLVSCAATRTVEVNLPGGPGLGKWKASIYLNSVNDMQALALVKGDIVAGDEVLVRVCSHSLMGNVFGVGPVHLPVRLRGALERINEEGKGVVLYLHGPPDLVQELSGHRGDTAPTRGVVMRDIGLGSQILRDLGVERMRLMTNTPNRILVEGFGLQIAEFVPFDEQLGGGDVVPFPGGGRDG